MQALSTYDIFYLDRMDFVDILPSMKNQKSVKYLKSWVVLNSLKYGLAGIWHFFESSGPIKIEKFKFWL